MMISEDNKRKFLVGLEAVQRSAHANASKHGFWDILDYLKRLCYVKKSIDPEWHLEMRNAVLSQKISLMHEELSELLGALRSGNPTEPCKKVPTINVMEEEAADLLIRLVDFCGEADIRLGVATLLKMDYNAGRPHMHGKKF